MAGSFITITAETTDEDKGEQSIKEAVRAMKTIELMVGVLDSAGTHRDAGIHMAELMNLHEFGIGVPERSVIRATIDENVDVYNKLMADLIDDIVMGRRTPKDAVSILGEQIVSDMKKRFGSADLTPLSKATIASKTKRGKAGNRPLIDTAQLRNSVNYEVKT